VWALAIWRAGSAALAATTAVNGPMNASMSAAPSSLKAMWATATRLASAVAPTDAVSAVAQVPMLAPSTMATAPLRPISPWLASASATPSVAAEDATSALKAADTRMAISVLPATASMSSMASRFSRSGAMPSRITLRPRNTRPRPRIAWPTSLSTCRPARNVIAKPRPTSRSA